MDARLINGNTANAGSRYVHGITDQHVVCTTEYKMYTNQYLIVKESIHFSKFCISGEQIETEQGTVLSVATKAFRNALR